MYLCSFEVFARMLETYPFIPWELSKYLIISSSFLLIIFSKTKIKLNILGIVLLILLIPSILIDKSNSVIFSDISFNLLGMISTSLLIVIFYTYKIKDVEFDQLLRLLWYTSVSLLVYTILKTPNYEEMEFTLGAGFQATAGYGSNQVTTILGIGMFISFYAWMNKLLFSGIHSVDGLFIGLFAYQGFLTFSRGGMIIGIMAMLIYYLFFRISHSFKRVIRLRRIRPFIFFGLAVVLLIISYISIENITKGNISLRYLGETSGTLSGEKIKTINSITTGRYEIFLADIALWSDYPIFGTGIGASTFLRKGNLRGISPHSEFSRLLAEHGILGVLIIIVLLYAFLNAYRRNHNNIYSAILFVLFFIAIGTAMHSAMRTFVTPIFIALSGMHVMINDKAN